MYITASSFRPCQFNGDDYTSSVGQRQYGLWLTLTSVGLKGRSTMVPLQLSFSVAVVDSVIPFGTTTVSSKPPGSLLEHSHGRKLLS